MFLFFLYLFIHLIADSSQASHQTGCFTGDSTVQTSTGETRLLSELRIGEKVLSMDRNGELKFSKVFMFLDRVTDQQREFVRIETNSNNQTTSITATPSHLIYIWSKNNDLMADKSDSLNFKFAELVEVGDYVMVAVNGTLEPQRVKKISIELHKGVYAPLTYDGTIVVNSVTASCYALVEKHNLAHWSFAPMRALHTAEEFIGISNGIDMTHMPRGIHWYAAALNKFKDIFLPSKWFYQT